MVHAGPASHKRSGVVGIARLQTARLSAVLYPPPLRDDVAPVACTVTLVFNRADGTPYLTREGRPIQRQVALLPDRSLSLDLRAADVFIDDPNIRAAFSASVQNDQSLMAPTCPREHAETWSSAWTSSTTLPAAAPCSSHIQASSTTPTSSTTRT